MTVDLRLGDCLEVMAAMEPNSVDAIVTDPPYGLEFMGKEWDRFSGAFSAREEWAFGNLGGLPRQRVRNIKCPDCERWIYDHPARACLCGGVRRQQLINFERWSYTWATAALRVAKPGAHLLAFGGTRTFHRLACAIEDAGWEIRDCVMWVHGQGFPKSHDVSKAIDKAAACVRQRVPGGQGGQNVIFGSRKIGEAISGEAEQWQGWGTALKPAWEPIIVARKPLVGTVAENVLKWGPGAMNIDGCRVETGDNCARKPSELKPGAIGYLRDDRPLFGGKGSNMGRWPANLIHDGSEEVLAGFPQTTTGSGHVRKSGNARRPGGWLEVNRSDAYWQGDSGSAARFFYCAKASRAEREAGCDALGAEAMHPIGDATISTQSNRRCLKCGRVKFAQSRCECVEPEWVETAGSKHRNNHPTVKPVALMRYLCRLVTPPNGIILDPFMGSGSTGIAAKEEGFNFIGIEIAPGYFEIAEKRIEEAGKQGRLALSEETK